MSTVAHLKGSLQSWTLVPSCDNLYRFSVGMSVKFKNCHHDPSTGSKVAFQELTTLMIVVFQGTDLPAGCLTHCAVPYTSRYISFLFCNFNELKCILLSFQYCNNKSPNSQSAFIPAASPYEINSHVVIPQSQHKDLGIVMSHDLSWTKQCHLS